MNFNKSFLTLILLLVSICAMNLIAGTINAQSEAPKLQDQINAQLTGAKNKAEVGDYVDPRQVAASIISVVLSLIGTFFFVLLIMSGYWLVTARGDESKVEKAQATIRSAVIGIIIVVMAYAITYFVSTRILATAGPPGRARPSGCGVWSLNPPPGC